MADEATPSKPGYKTSEFWLTIAAQILPILLGTGIVHGTDGEKYGAMGVQILSLFGYTASRTIAKK